MYIRVIIAICLTVLIGCGGVKSERAEKPSFKGIELYSWKPAGEDWHFSLLAGTNREKAASEITSPEVTIAGIENLKQKLSTLAKGESIFWTNLAKEPPRGEIVTELDRFCRSLDIKLVYESIKYGNQ